MITLRPRKFKQIPKGLPCVYRLIFADGSFYIGSTLNMKARIGTHVSCISHDSKNAFYSRIKGINLNRLDILAIVWDKPTLRKVESLLIKESIKLKKCLNNTKRQSDLPNLMLITHLYNKSRKGASISR